MRLINHKRILCKTETKVSTQKESTDNTKYEKRKAKTLAKN